MILLPILAILLDDIRIKSFQDDMIQQLERLLPLTVSHPF